MYDLKWVGEKEEEKFGLQVYTTSGTVRGPYHVY